MRKRPFPSQPDTTDTQELGNRPRIHVAPVVTTLSDGKPLIPPPQTPVVEALLAATAVVPFFKPVELGLALGKTAHCIDAVNVANEPTFALIEYLKGKVKDASSVNICPVTSFPTTTSSMPNGAGGYTRLMDIVLRVLELRRGRTANLERKLVRLYTKLLPKSGTSYAINGKNYIAAQLFPIEPDTPLRVNERLAAAKTGEEKEQIVFGAIAAGCRATLEVLIQPHMQGNETRHIPCRKAMAQLDAHPLPGSNPDTGPGLDEVCSRCSVSSLQLKQSLRVLKEKTQNQEWLEWPHQDPSKESRPTKKEEEPLHSDVTETKDDEGAPVTDQTPSICEVPNNHSPCVSLLFSGGVFRGVFQVGVLNALEQVKLSPRLFAGSSVGSIMAAMAARLFADLHAC